MPNFSFRTALPSDYERIMTFLSEYFFKEEPFIRASGASVEEMMPIFSEMVRNSLKYPFSTLVTSESGELAATLLNSIWRRGHSEEEESGDNNNYSRPIQELMKILESCHSDFWTLAPSTVDVVLYREISSVGTPWQRQGIATRMVTESLTPERLKEYNVGGVVSATSSFANQTLLAKQGFKCLKEYPYQNIVNTDDGSKGMRLNFKNIEDFGLEQ